MLAFVGGEVYVLAVDSMMAFVSKSVSPSGGEDPWSG
jgi:hypothetical protein